LLTGSSRRIFHLVAALALSAVTAACSVRLASPYNQAIYQGAQSLEDDFVRFVAMMQDVAGTPDGYYVKHRSTYADFAARLAVLRRRSETLAGGAPCSRALEIARKVGRNVDAGFGSQVAERTAAPGMEAVSCTTVIVILAQDQMERLRSQHERRCNPATAALPRRCTTLFGAPPIYGVFNTGPTTEASASPLVSAVAITLDELVGIQEDVKPAPAT
jgi:hypothetical protein